MSLKMAYPLLFLTILPSDAPDNPKKIVIFATPTQKLRKIETKT